MAWWEILLYAAALFFAVFVLPFFLEYSGEQARIHAFLDKQVLTYDDTIPRRVIQYKFDGVLHQHEVKTVTQVDDGVIAFTDTDGRDFLVHTDEWREVNVPVGVTRRC